MLKKSFHLCTGAEASSLVTLRAAGIMQGFSVVVRLAVAVLVSILISHSHAAPA